MLLLKYLFVKSEKQIFRQIKKGKHVSTLFVSSLIWMFEQFLPHKFAIKVASSNIFFYIVGRKEKVLFSFSGSFIFTKWIRNYFLCILYYIAFTKKSMKYIGGVFWGMFIKMNDCCHTNMDAVVYLYRFFLFFKKK